MNIEEYIESGILELYVAGALSEKENKEVAAMVKKHEAIRKELELVEKTILTLTKAAAPEQPGDFSHVLRSINASGGKLVRMNKWSRLQRLGWAAVLIISLGALIWTLGERNRLFEERDKLVASKDSLLLQIEDARSKLAENTQLLAQLRAKDVILVPLQGQGQFENSYAKAYWNKERGELYIDAQGLPEPPEGKEYQLWSLQLDPLSPTSLGLLSDLTLDEDKIFSIENPYASEAFGITLEPLGGSESPTMEQLYTLGVVPSS
jgi:anti-sigma-K factor RskA